MINFADNTNGCHILDFTSKKSNYFVRSIIAVRTLAVISTFEAVYALYNAIENIFGCFPRKTYAHELQAVN